MILLQYAAWLFGYYFHWPCEFTTIAPAIAMPLNDQNKVYATRSTNGAPGCTDRNEKNNPLNRV